MADLHRHSVQEALNSEASAVYSVNSALTIGSSATAVDVSAFHIVHVQTTEDIYVHFNTSNTESNLSTSNDLYLNVNQQSYPIFYRIKLFTFINR